MAERVLVVDDEAQITRVLRTALSAQGYDVRAANDPEEALRVFEEWSPDLLVTDLMMPGMSGVELCRLVRSRTATPIIVLSVRDQERSKVEALDAGADDYVTKPFSIQELLARVRAHLRRAPERMVDAPIEIGDFVIDAGAHTVTVGGNSLHLTPTEFDLLLYMARNAGKALTHRALLTAVGAASRHTSRSICGFLSGNCGANSKPKVPGNISKRSPGSGIGSCLKGFRSRRST